MGLCRKCNKRKAVIEVTLPDGDIPYCEDCLLEFERRVTDAFHPGEEKDEQKR